MDKKILKVLVSGYDLKFWNNLQKELEKTGLFEFKQDTTIGNYNHNDQKALELIEWADVLFAEWTLNNAVFFSNNKKPHQKLITRFHLQERLTDFPNKINYKNVDAVVFVGAHIMRESIDKFNIPKEICHVIGNFIDMGKFLLPKLGGSEFNIGIIGVVPARKRLDLVFETLEELLKINNSYRLHIKGPSPTTYPWLWKRENEKKYYEQLYTRINSSELRNHVVFDPPGNDVNYWLQKIGYILSPSDFESFHVAICEGVSSSALPIVWNWEGADEIYPSFPLVNTPNSAAKFIDMMRKNNVGDRLLQQSMELVKCNYNSDVIAYKFTDLMLGNTVTKANIDTLNHISKVIIVYSITNFNIFHRKEMLLSLSKNLDSSTYLLIVEPGSHYTTLLDKGLDDQISLNKFANCNIIPIGKNIGRIKAIYGNIPLDVNCDDKLRKISSLKESIAYFISNNFNSKIEVYHWLYKPDQIKLVGNQPYFYEVYDEYTMDFATGELKTEVVELEEKVLSGACYVFFTSKPLLERKKHCIKHGLFKCISNGVVFELFNKYAFNEEIVSKKRKSVGYLGNLSDFFDWELIYNICKKREDLDFFFHGQLELKNEKDQDLYFKIKDLHNTFFSGRVTREQGAAAINRYDVLIIPFVINDVMHAVNPLKLWEYFATGKPVISSPMDAITIKSPELYVASSLDEWLENIDLALSENINSEAKKNRIKMAENLSWDILTKEYAIAINEVMQ